LQTKYYPILNTFENTLAFAQSLDAADTLAPFRERFHFPQLNGKQAIYLTGNSLGLEPKSARAALEQEMLDWQNLGVEGHFDGTNPWFHYHKFSKRKGCQSGWGLAT
jgi:kynureninase